MESHAASIAIFGDFDPATVKKMVEKYFGSIPSGPPVPPVNYKTQPITQEKQFTVSDQVELPRAYMLWITTPYFIPGEADADMVAHVLGGSKPSHLYKRLLYELQIALGRGRAVLSPETRFLLYVQVTSKPGVTDERVQTAIDDELASFRKDGPTAQEVERASNSIQSAMVFRLQRMVAWRPVEPLRPVSW